MQARSVRCVLTSALAASTALAQAPAPADSMQAPAPVESAPAPPAPVESAPAPQPAPPPPAPPLPALTPQTAWAHDYEDARRLLLDGRFDEAIARFKVLAEYAATPRDATLVAELTRLATEWKARGTHFVHGSELPDDSVIARRENRRTTDEIAVLYFNGVAYGLGTGAFIAVHTDPKEPAGAILPALALGGAGAAGVALLDSGNVLHYGVPQSIGSGLYLGLAEGITWSVWNQARVVYYEEWRDKTVATVIWASATAGAVGGGVIGATFGTTPGRASYVTSAGLWSGAVAGLMTSAFAPKDDHNDDSALLAAIIGLNLGALGGVLSADAVSPTIARVRFLDLGGVAGGILAGGIFYSAAGKHPDERALAGTVGIGIAAGIGLSALLTRNMPEDRPEPKDTGTRTPSYRLGVTPVPGGLSLTASGEL